MELPDIELPEGFQPQSMNLIIQGICPECNL
jgi:Fe2+ or Zn2+ uptake regulation protein